MTIKQNHYRHPFAGYTIGILAPNLDYEKMLGNVANTETFDFPVLYEVVDIDLELLFQGDESLNETITPPKNSKPTARTSNTHLLQPETTPIATY